MAADCEPIFVEAHMSSKTAQTRESRVHLATPLDAIGSFAAVRERWLAADAFVADVALLFQRLVAAHKRQAPMATLSVLADLVETPSG
ncbi:hypothetical protein ATCC90586_010695 [Pythium insidiosum]|nr:hypothetical protein ATCC90586_010695 [Pythium insidiosum]